MFTITPSNKIQQVLSKAKSRVVCPDPVSLGYLVAQARDKLPRCLVVLLPDEADGTLFSASYRFFASIFGQRRGPFSEIREFPGWELSPYSRLAPGLSVRSDRLRALHSLNFEIDTPLIIPTTLKAISQPTMNRAFFCEANVAFAVGMEVGLEALTLSIDKLGYALVNTVEDPGTYARRGGILDVYPINSRWPLRLEFFGDEIESIRYFNPQTQRTMVETPVPSGLLRVSVLREFDTSQANLEKARERIRQWCDEREFPRASRERVQVLLGDGIVTPEMDYLISFFADEPAFLWDHLPEQAGLIQFDPQLCVENFSNQQARLQEDFARALEQQQLAVEPEKISLDLSSIQTALAALPRSIEVKTLEDLSDREGFDYVAKTLINPQKGLQKRSKSGLNVELSGLLEQVRLKLSAGKTGFFIASSQAQIDRLYFLLSQNSIPSTVFVEGAPMKVPPGPGILCLTKGTLPWGFTDDEIGTFFLTEDEVFGRKKHDSEQSRQAIARGVERTSLDDLLPGEHLVHSAHGIGRYGGLVRLNTGGTEGDYLLLEYAEADKLYVPVYRLDSIQKYIGASDANPVVDKLGSQNFTLAKARAREAVQKVALDLLNIYARRAAAKGHAYAAPGEEFRAFEAAFPFDETPDQLKVIEDTIEDMTSDRPMDRLICGDVGYGKTEVAMRAAYLAVLDGRQVSVLVPTTVLAEQHLHSFRNRFADTGVRIESLSRFRSAKEQKEIVAKIEAGQVDIAIGTHRLLSKDIKFKNLGLMIVDEEQRFGVEHKEKLKKLRVNTDVLTLSATPIPRTLHFSLLGIRDISVIQTPPADRHAIKTFVSKFDQDIIREGMRNELQRGGQIFFIHNRVQSIGSVLRTLNEICPEAKIGVAHGQMVERQLEQVMVDFYQKKFDVLLATAIIENGLDVPNANTIFVDRADTFGLSQLYQIRGRVGRSQTRAFAYLLLPEDREVTNDAKQRLQVLQRHVELGSGFAVSSYDLELRGAGDILGDAQSGHVTDIGYDLYMEMLAEEIALLKGEEPEVAEEVEISTSIPAYLPEDLIADVRTRLSVYKRLSSHTSEESLDEAEFELQDRFGTLPTPAKELLWLLKVKILLRRYGLRSIKISPDKIALEAGKSPKIDISKLLQFIHKDPKRYSLTPDSKVILRAESQRLADVYEKVQSFVQALHSA